MLGALWGWVRNWRKKPEARLAYDWFLDEPCEKLQPGHPSPADPR